MEPYHTVAVRRRGKISVSGNCIWHAIAPTNGAERTDYPTQKSMGLVRRFLQAHTLEGERCLDPFAGSGTLGVVAWKMSQPAVLIDVNAEAIGIMRDRLGWPARPLG